MHVDTTSCSKLCEVIVYAFFLLGLICTKNKKYEDIINGHLDFAYSTLKSITFEKYHFSSRNKILSFEKISMVQKIEISTEILRKYRYQ